MDNSTSWVAIVDDESMVRRVIMRVLRLAKIPACEFASGASFLAALDRHRPSCIVLDIVMPEMNGIEVCSQIKRRAPGLPVILMSGNTTCPARVSAELGSMVSFLEKPMHAATLIAAIRAALSTQKREQSDTANSAQPDCLNPSPVQAD